jgi:hypothetical protein
MDSNQIIFLLSKNAENLSPEVLTTVRSELEQMSETQLMYLQSASFQKPSTIQLRAIFWGWERFFQEDIALGALKAVSFYGCGICWLANIFTANKPAQQFNFQQFQNSQS